MAGFTDDAKGGGPKGPRYSIVLVPITVEETSLMVEVTVKRGDVAVEGVELVFYRDGVPEVGVLETTDNQGKRSHIFKFPKGTASVKIKVEAVVSGSPSKEFNLPIVSSVSAKPAVPDLSIESNGPRKGVYGYTFGLFRGDYATAGTLEFHTQGKLLFDNEEKTGEWELEIPETGRRFIKMEALIPEVELDIFVKGYNKQFQVTLLGSREIAPIPRSRVVFALICVAVFLVSVFAWLMGELVIWIAPVAIVVATILGYAIKPEALKLCLKTNNRWWGCMLLLCVASFVLAVGTGAGRPVILSASDRPAAESSFTRAREQQERNYNRYKGHGFKTNAELEKGRKAVVSYPAWITWLTRWCCCLWLSCAEFVYTFFAFSDEIRVAYQRGRNRLRTREGTTATFGLVPSFAKMFSKNPAAVVPSRVRSRFRPR
jgi:hypothetical protein